MHRPEKLDSRLAHCWARIRAPQDGQRLARRAPTHSQQLPSLTQTASFGDIEIQKPFLWRGLERCGATHCLCLDAVPVRAVVCMRKTPHLTGRNRPPGYQVYNIGRLFACCHCYRRTYESQQQSPRDRVLAKAQKIRLRLGGSANMFKEFPDKPKYMHWLTYHRLRYR